MDLSILYYDKKFSDFELILKDKYTTISLHVHRIILANNCDYFYKMFNFNLQLKSQEMIVPVAYIMRDLILSFYGIKNPQPNTIPNWLYVLETFKCRNFLCLPNDTTLLYNLNVPKENFEQLLEILDHFDIQNNKNLLKVLKKNLPIDYDTSLFSKDILDALRLMKEELVVISGSADKTIKIWKVETGELVIKNVAHHNNIWNVLISNDKKNLFSGSSDGSIKIWNIEQDKLIKKKTFTTKRSKVYSISISPDDQYLVSGHSNGSIKIWNASSGDLIHHIVGKDKKSYAVRCVAFSPDNQSFVSCSSNQLMTVWNPTSGKKIFKKKMDYVINVVTYSFDGRQIVTGDYRGTINLWNAETGTLIKSINGHNECLWSLAFSNDGEFMVSAGEDKIIKLWNAKTFDLIYTIKEEYTIYTVTFSRNDQYIISGDHHGHINTWNRIDKKLVYSINTHGKSVLSLASEYLFL